METDGGNEAKIKRSRSSDENSSKKVKKGSENGEESATRTGWSTTDLFGDIFAVKKPLTEPEKPKNVAPAHVQKVASKGAVKPKVWTGDEPVPYHNLAKVFDKCESSGKRLEMTRLVCEFFQEVICLRPEDLLPCVYLVGNTLAPAYENLELGVGENLIKDVIKEAFHKSLKNINEELKEQGDLGIVAFNAGSVRQKTFVKLTKLSVREVFQQLRKVSKTSGKNSRQEKTNIVLAMMRRANKVEAKYLVRHLQGKMRMHVGRSTVLAALGQAATLCPPHLDDPRSFGQNLKKSKTEAQLSELLEEGVNLVKTAYSECPSYDSITAALLADPIENLPQTCRLTLGIPIEPMLAKPMKEVQFILQKLSSDWFTVEYKYDGERAQIHLKEDGSVMIASRNLEDHTEKYPDLIQDFKDCVEKDTKTAILDCEVVAYDQKKKKILPFQELSTRKKKGENVSDSDVRVMLFAFDCLYLNGESLLMQPFWKRRRALHESFTEVPCKFNFASYLNLLKKEEKNEAEAEAEENVTDEEMEEEEEGNEKKLETIPCVEGDPHCVVGDDDDLESAIMTMFNKSVNDACEGLMCKSLRVSATYEPSKRSNNWLKLKKDYLAGLADTADLVPIGGYYGAGKRTKWIGSYLMACYNHRDEIYETVCKVGTGLKEKELQEFTDFFLGTNEDAEDENNKSKIVEKQPSNYNVADKFKDGIKWFSPATVWEIAAADLSVSPEHTAANGIVDDSKGIAMRFPRFLRNRGDEKNPQQASTSEFVAELYRNQAAVSTD